MSRAQPITPPASSEQPPELAPQHQAKKGKRADLLSPLRLHRLSTSTYNPAADKGKTPTRGSEHHDSPSSSSQVEHGFDNRDKFSSHHVKPRPGSAAGYRPPSTNLNRKRGSLLVAASDALGFKFNRKRQTIPARLPTTTTFLPEIIEITAHRSSDAEWEERERLREEAAQCLGISVEQDTASVTQTTEENDIANFSTNSLPSPTRRRSGSSITHYRRASNPAIPIPSFPASIHGLKDFAQLSANLPMFYAPNSLRIFALSKNWKVRSVVLTSPAFPMTHNSEPAVSYLHIFKSSAADEREIERLEINENSVVFIAEEDVGGRRRVVKVGGGEKNGTRKNQVIEDGRITWFFHIPDLVESQKWIATIKNVILAQRTLRAGLVLPSLVPGGIEPRGDMDVMLSIRQQGIVTVPSTLRQSTSITDRSGHYASSISSQSIKSQTTGPKTPPSSNSPGALKSLFIPRPRATSSLDSDRENESFLSMSHLINKWRPSVAESRKSSEKSFVPPLSTFMSASHTLERKIVSEHLPDSLPNRLDDETASPARGDWTSQSLNLSGSSLQPPPRKRRGSEALTLSLTAPVPPYYDTLDGSLIVDPPQCPDGPTSNQRFSHFGSPKQRPRVQSAHSISTIASGDNTTSQDMSSISTKRSSNRWSRQSVLPPRPGGPPPLAPLNTHLQPHPYAAEQGISRTPSNQSEKSVTTSLAPFSPERTSTASALSMKSGTSQSLGISTSRSSHTSSSHRSSMLPSKPAPSFALPPAPDLQSKSPTPNKSSFRESVASHVGRLSMIAPKPAPTANLPPRPDERLSKSHRRASSGSYFTTPAHHNTSTSSLTTHVTASPFPPPLGPLPPTPKSQSPSTSPSPPAQNENLIMRRLRMLSAPSTPPIVIDDNLPVDISIESSRPRSNTVTTPIVQAPKPVLASLLTKPAMPIAEKIMSFQDDPSFLHFDTPTIPPLPPPRVLQHIADQSAGMTSLSPPPRRGSRQIFPAEIPEPDNVILSTPTPKPSTDGERRLISLSRPGSVVSLGIVSM
ncbi:hypothetical protein M378DRAFT_159060 [Amanita muscaria Koide BX008]|uniref:Uncharacterized protein n=1 Tax=Amanita muscaria (strain Koide BX008) TaxID=946122 RepID=A0A0C2SWK9_AMAMK|nr:hypothetical protein M378DRAFT_159060 [Amanita muscaria Koide BX008]